MAGHTPAGAVVLSVSRAYRRRPYMGGDERGGRARKASPWPVPVALGIVATEVGVLFVLLPLAIGGVLAFGWSCSGMAIESGYAASRWPTLRCIGAVLGGGSALVWTLRTPAISPRAFVASATSDAIAIRAAVVLAAGMLLVAAGYAGALYRRMDDFYPRRL